MLIHYAPSPKILMNEKSPGAPWLSHAALRRLDDLPIYYRDDLDFIPVATQDKAAWRALALVRVGTRGAVLNARTAARSTRLLLAVRRPS